MSGAPDFVNSAKSAQSIQTLLRASSVVPPNRADPAKTGRSARFNAGNVTFVTFFRPPESHAIYPYGRLSVRLSHIAHCPDIHVAQQ